jgi:disulfide bond formation protein DsbB
LTHDVTVVLAALGVAGQALAAGLLVLSLLALAGLPGPLAAVRSAVWGYELWLGFLIAAVGTGGSLFFSEIANFPPCDLCWFERVCMYPLSITLFLAALLDDPRVTRYLLPLPVVGIGIAVYHLLVENGVVGQTQACLLSAPGGCATKWIDEFGFVTIPVLSLTSFALLLLLMSFALLEPGGPSSAATVDGNAQRKAEPAPSRGGTDARPAADS